MEMTRIRELRAELEAERIDLTELAEIDEAFEKLVAAKVELRDLPENAMAADKLDELEKIESDAHTIANYMTLASIETERQDVEDVVDEGDTYSGVYTVLAVLKRAEELMQ